MHLPGQPNTFLALAQDLVGKIYLRPEALAQLKRVLRKDTEFLERYRVMDYSLLLGAARADAPAAQQCDLQRRPSAR